MISATILQSAYVDLYAKLREYIWDFSVIEAIADLEISVYKAFPDVTEIYKNLSNLKYLVSGTYAVRSDDEILPLFEDFESKLDDNDIYIDLVTFKEVII